MTALFSPFPRIGAGGAAMRRLAWTACLMAAMTGTASAAAEGTRTKGPAPTDISAVVRAEGVDPARAALLIIRRRDRAEWRSGGDRIGRRFPPASTSKIPHTLIALETGLAGDGETRFEWDGVERALPVWNQDQTLATAFARSAVWVYQRITSRLGRGVMSDWITRFGYGNADVGGENDLTTYWLRGPLAISAREQTVFLEKLIDRTLPLSDRTYDIGRRVIRTESGEGWSLYSKTGWRQDGVNTDIGWYVGWLETANPDTGTNKGMMTGDTYVFAFNMDMPDPAQDVPKRIRAVKAALSRIGALPAP